MALEEPFDLKVDSVQEQPLVQQESLNVVESLKSLINRSQLITPPEISVVQVHHQKEVALARKVGDQYIC